MQKFNRNSSADEKKLVADAVYDFLMEYFFDEIVFINLAFSDLGGGGTTSTTNFGTASRIIDSAEGFLMAPGKSSRLRCQFYLRSPSTMEGYILSPAVFDATSLPSPFTSMDSLRSYVGIKILNDKVYSVVKEQGKSEVAKLLDFQIEMDTATFSKTYALEIIHNVGTTEIKINNTSYGTITSDLVGTIPNSIVFYPFFSPARSTTGAQVNIVSENIQFIQRKK